MLKLLAFAKAFSADGTGAPRRREEGQTMAEYGVVLSVITVAIIAAISLLSTNVGNALDNVAGLLPG